MHTQLLLSSSPFKHITKILVLLSFSLLTIVSTCYCSQEDDERYYDCNQTYSCGKNIQSISYPFWGDDRPQFCGNQAFELKCQNGEYPTIFIDNRSFRVLAISQSTHVMSLVSSDLWNGYCTQDPSNFTLNTGLFGEGQAVRELFISYNCTPAVPAAGLSNRFTCPIDGSRVGGTGFYAEETLAGLPILSCSVVIEVPVLQVALDKLSNGTWSLQEALNQGFELVYKPDFVDCLKCEGSGGMCGSNPSSLEFVCLCRGGSDDRLICKKSGSRLNVPRKLAIGFGAAGFTLLVMGVILWIRQYRRNKRSHSPSFWISRNLEKAGTYSGVKNRNLEKAGTYNGVQVFSYKELEEATGNFDSNKELGDGGFGIVYEGKLRDGRVVAVKRLFEHNFKRVEQFMNEVEILTRLRHQNLVSLYGSTSHHCRELLLVYEYVPNGTVADHLHGEQAKPELLSWTTRMSIAIETACALAYLHNSDVIHRDVKTANILLDNNFGVKVADFGLSRLFPTNVTHVSTAPQGTPGYVDPEYHECYQLTNKSDVYSFGVVLMELISSKPAVDITRHRLEINLSNMAINKIQNNALHELVDPCLGFDSAYEVRKMIYEVAELAFQCLQSERNTRPSMEEVLEVLNGIQSGGINKNIVDEVDIPANDVLLLDIDTHTLSPDSVMTNWISSRGTTPNASC